jgi:hypothetical protein
MRGADNTNSLAQLDHINTEIKAVDRVTKESQAIVKRLKGMVANVPNQADVAIANIILSDDFKTTMDAEVEEQYNQIVNNNAAFKDVRKNPSISKAYTGRSTPFISLLYQAMATEAYCNLLSAKLGEKAKEVAATL